MIAIFKFVVQRTKFTKESPGGENYNETSTQILNLNDAILKNEKGRVRSRSEVETILKGMRDDLGANSMELQL